MGDWFLGAHLEHEFLGADWDPGTTDAALGYRSWLTLEWPGTRVYGSLLGPQCPWKLPGISGAFWGSWRWPVLS